MNSSIYVFGNLGSDYTQYPDDFTQNIFRVFNDNASSESQLIIRRDDNLMYYGYIRKLDVTPQYIGLCVMLNGVMFLKPKTLFTVFENTVADLVARGIILQFDDNGKITSKISYLSQQQQEVERVATILNHDISGLEARKLPPVSYGISNTAVKRFPLSEKNETIAEASHQYGFTVVSKKSGSDTVSINSFKATISRLNKEKADWKQKFQEQQRENIKLQTKQRNMFWVGLLSLLLAVMFVILYFKVINPSEVTHYETDEFIYYGPLKNKKPHGVGVAIYPNDDKDGRKYYIGNFVDGKREDKNAILFYQDGDYYYGSMNGDNWRYGMFYLNSDNCYFRGRFLDNTPYTGTWYDYQERYSITMGKTNN